MKQEDDDFYLPAIKFWDGPTPMGKAIEEMGELIVALSQHKLDRATNEEVMVEIVDVLIMVRQLIPEYGGREKFEEAKFKKIKKLKTYLNEYIKGNI